jgi:hypothetical protein
MNTGKALRLVTPCSEMTPVGILLTPVCPTVVPSGKIDARFSILNTSIVSVFYSSNYPTFDKGVAKEKRATGITDLSQVTDLSQILKNVTSALAGMELLQKAVMAELGLTSGEQSTTYGRPAASATFYYRLPYSLILKSTG